MIALVFSFLLAAPVRPLDFIETMKPVAIEPADSPLRKLQKQRYNEQLRGVQRYLNSFYVRGCPRPPFGPVLDVISPLAAAGAALEETAAGRVKWCEFGIAAHRDLERIFHALADGGLVLPHSVNLARAARIDAQIELLTNFPTANSPLLHLKDIPARPNPKIDREPRQPKLPTLIEAAVKPDVKDTLLRKLQKARVRERAVYVAMTNEVIAIGQWEHRYFRDFGETQMRLGANLAEILDQPADKVKAFELRLDGMKELERIYFALVDAGRVSPQHANAARAARLDAEIELLRLRIAHKLAEGKLPEVKYGYPELLALWKLPPFVLDAIKPDEKDTALRKLQKARAGDRLVANEKHKEAIRAGGRGEELLTEAVRYPAALAESLADLADTPADRIRVYEMWLERMKEFEKYIAEQTETGHVWPYDIPLATAARLEAEIALLNVKEAAKAGK